MTNEGLTIKNAQPEDEGVYYCQASVPSTGELKRIEINVQVMCKYFLKFQIGLSLSGLIKAMIFFYFLVVLMNLRIIL
jgi:hypothetical protein